MGKPKTSQSTAVKIGLEIHGYLAVPSQVKLFCNCSLSPAEPNTNICPVCTGQPGSKPMAPNKEAIDAILKIALFLECELNPVLLWQRKHYSWPDLPNGYQKTMSGAYSQPVGLNGNFLGVGIEEIHLEEDPARWDPVSGGVDYNRSGFPLVEIVTKPEFTSSVHVREWIENLIVALSYIKAVRRDLGIKCDVNVSIGPHFIRTEVKNVNSFSAIVEAIEHEITRQNEEQKQNKTAVQQTRAWDEQSGTTKFMRSKETAQDYQFIPDPDLPLIHVSENVTAPLRKSLPERPDQKQKKYSSLGMPSELATKLSRNLYFANAAEEDAELTNVPLEFAANRYLNEIAGIVADDFERVGSVPLEARTALLLVFHKRIITNLQFKELYERLYEGDLASVKAALSGAESSKQSTRDLVPLVKEAILARPEAALDVRSGKDKAINAIVGYVLSALKKEGKSADPAEVQRIVREHL